MAAPCWECGWKPVESVMPSYLFEQILLSCDGQPIARDRQGPSFACLRDSESESLKDGFSSRIFDHRAKKCLDPLTAERYRDKFSRPGIDVDYASLHCSAC